MTFSIAARCPRTGQLGVATASASLACGAFAPSVQTNTGAIASQAFANPFFGIDGMRLLAGRHPPEKVVTELIAADPGRDLRQLLVVDGVGHAAGFTGAECISWAGHHQGRGYVAGGNTLAGGHVLMAMAAEFEAAEEEELAERLLRALEAGEAAGGDRRGRQSAAVLVAYDQDYRFYDLRVDSHENPLMELRRCFELRLEAAARAGDFRPTRETPLPPGFLEAWPEIKTRQELEATGRPSTA